MECKGWYERLWSRWSGFIGIYPEWNVKITVPIALRTPLTIGIYPEWNVKYKFLPLFPFEFLHWNISRMECKGLS